MGQNIKILRTRIKSVDSTLHLTKAMGLVASSKVKKANERMLKSREYSSALNQILEALLSSKDAQKSPYAIRRNGNRTRIIVVAGDRGMAGGYNANIFRFIRGYEGAEVIALGKRACDKYSQPFKSSEDFLATEAYELAVQLCKDYLDNKFDVLAVVSTKYESMMSQVPIYTEILPLSVENCTNNSTIFEPDEVTILNSIIPEYVAGKISSLVKEAFACEITSRMTAMDSAGKNAKEMIDSLMLEYNRARQGAITQEITEIVAGSGN